MAGLKLSPLPSAFTRLPPADDASDDTAAGLSTGDEVGSGILGRAGVSFLAGAGSDFAVSAKGLPNGSSASAAGAGIDTGTTGRAALTGMEGRALGFSTGGGGAGSDGGISVRVGSGKAGTGFSGGATGSSAGGGGAGCDGGGVGVEGSTGAAGAGGLGAESNNDDRVVWKRDFIIQSDRWPVNPGAIPVLLS